MEGIFCEVGPGKIDPDWIFRRTHHVEHGGMNFFFGSVRRMNAGKEVVTVSYDAFEPLALRILREIANEARVRWGSDLRIAISHRTGNLEPGEISMGVGVSSRHRDESYQASRFVVEQIKHRAPIWKKEVYENGETEWLKGHALCQRAGDHEGHHHG